MKVSQKLISGFFAIVILTEATVYIGVNFSRHAGEILEGVEKKYIPSATALLEMKAATRQASLKQ